MRDADVDGQRNVRFTVEAESVHILLISFRDLLNVNRIRDRGAIHLRPRSKAAIQ